MASEKSRKERAGELLEQRNDLIRDAILTDPEWRAAISEGLEAEARGDLVTAAEFFAKDGTSV